jgi:hypothetical protein
MTAFVLAVAQDQVSVPAHHRRESTCVPVPPPVSNRTAVVNWIAIAGCDQTTTDTGRAQEYMDAINASQQSICAGDCLLSSNLTLISPKITCENGYLCGISQYRIQRTRRSRLLASATLPGRPVYCSRGSPLPDTACHFARSARSGGL